MTDWTVPAELAQPTPRDARMRTAGKIAMWLIPLPFILLALLIAVIILQQAYKDRKLLTRGQEIAATITEKDIQKTKNGSYYEIKYTYRLGQSLDPQDRLYSADFSVSDADAESLEIGQKIAVIYDPLRPYDSEVKARLYAPRPSVWTSNVLPVLMFPQMGGTIDLIIYLIYLRQKRILEWGHAASAEIVSEHEYHTKGGVLSKITYAFVDDKGVQRRGRKSGVPTDHARSNASAKRREALLKNPTVVFDPRNSRRNLFYPPSIAKLPARAAE